MVALVGYGCLVSSSFMIVFMLWFRVIFCTSFVLLCIGFLCLGNSIFRRCGCNGCCWDSRCVFRLCWVSFSYSPFFIGVFFRMFLQETYEIYDCTFIDYAVTGNKNTKWVNQQSGGSPCYTVTVDSEGTLITKRANGNLTPSTVADSTSWNDRLLINEPYAVEFDLVEINANGGTFRMYYNNSLQQQLDITGTGTGHYKFVMEQDKVYYIKDNGNPVTIADNLNITVVENPAFVNCASIKFKNFILYKI